MTTYLHVGDPYCKVFAARVTDVAGREVVLDQTCFFGPHPTICSDSGWLGDARVVGLRLTDRRTLGHVVARETGALPGVGELVEGAIDWPRRHAIMRLHTAQHLVEIGAGETHELALGRCGPVTEETASIVLDFEGPTVDLDAITDWVAAAIRDDLSCAVTTAPGAPSERRWHLDGYGFRRCEALHLRSTGEVGDVRCVARLTGPSRACVQLGVGGADRTADIDEGRANESRTDTAGDHSPRATGRQSAR